MPHGNRLPVASVLAVFALVAGHLAPSAGRARAADRTTTDGAATPAILAVYRLEDMPLPLPSADPSVALGFRLGGISDLFAIPRHDAEGPIEFWGVTDRGPNGLVTRAGSPGNAPEVVRTLPVPEFVPLLVRLSIPKEPTGADRGALRVSDIVPITTLAGTSMSGRPALGPDRCKPMVDPATAAILAVDPDGIDSEGLAPAPGGGFWLAEEYVPSLLRLDAAGRAVRRLVPEGVTLHGGGCEVVSSLPACCARRQDNRGFEALAVSPDGTTLYAMLQSPPVMGPGTRAEERIQVPLVVLDADEGTTRSLATYRLGDTDENALDVAAADGKISCIAALEAARLLVLEQSATHSRIYEIEVPGRGGDVRKTLVADLAALAQRFASDISPDGGTPEKPADLKFEGLAVLGPDVVALVNDNDFDMNSVGAAPASPPIRGTCLWVLQIALERP